MKVQRLHSADGLAADEMVPDPRQRDTISKLRTVGAAGEALGRRRMIGQAARSASMSTNSYGQTECNFVLSPNAALGVSASRGDRQSGAGA